MFSSLGLVLAGMPMPLVRVSEAARPRLDVISFFLVGLLLSAAVVMVVWNGLRRDFPRLPHLSYARACGVVLLWGLLFVIVLTMISGARELMTPGAWEKQGMTYKLRDEKAAAAQVEEWTARRTLIGKLQSALLEHARQHEGHYPASLDELSPEASAYEVPNRAGARYILVADRTLEGPALPLAYEPEVYAGKHFVVFTKGRPEELPYEEIQRLLEWAR
jgi:hypothetical protein